MEDQRQLVDVAGIGSVDDRLGVDVAEVGDLHLEVVGQRLGAAAHDQVGLDAAAAQLGDGVLRRLRLLLARRADERHERDVDVAHVVAAGFLAELADRLEERQDLDVADRAADLGDDDVDVVGGQPGDPPLDLVGDVGDHLHGLAEVVTAPLGGEHGAVDRSRRGVGVARQVLVDEPLVVTEVEVGLTAVVGDEHLAVLVRVHRPRVDVDVGIELLQRDAQPAQLEQAAERGSGEALAERTGDPTSHEDVFRHGTTGYPGPPPPPRTCARPAGGGARGRAVGRAAAAGVAGQHAGDLGDAAVAIDRLGRAWSRRRRPPW